MLLGQLTALSNCFEFRSPGVRLCFPVRSLMLQVTEAALDGLEKTDVAFLDEVGHLEATAGEVFRDRDDEAEVKARHPVAGGKVCGLVAGGSKTRDLAGERELLSTAHYIVADLGEIGIKVRVGGVAHDRSGLSHDDVSIAGPRPARPGPRRARPTREQPEVFSY